MKKPSIFDRPFRSIFWPPTLVARQLGSVLYFNHLIGWKGFFPWLVKHSYNSLPVAAGSIGMGCIGFPAHPAWEVTTACNLHCIHCHASGGKPVRDELTTEEGKRFIDELTRVSEFRMLVYTGGEPLVRPDLFELLHHSKRAGLANVIATNATLITEDVAFKLKEAGVVGVAVSLDSTQSEVHNYIRQKSDAFELAMRGIRACKKAGILLQINVTAMEYNLLELDMILEMADDEGAGIGLMYQLVPVGRGGDLEEATLKARENELLIKNLAHKQKGISTIFEPVAGPQYWPYIMERRGRSNGIWLKLAEQVFHGCAAGRGFVYIKANGDVWPCPFVPVKAGNVKAASFGEIWRQNEVFANLRNREDALKGGCGECKYRRICGGCRGRALAYHDDYLAEDPSCFLRLNLPNLG